MTDASTRLNFSFGKGPDFAAKNGPGVLVSTVLAITAQFLSEHYGAPAMLMALLLGIAFHFLAEEGRCVPGIVFTSRTMLRIGLPQTDFTGCGRRRLNNPVWPAWREASGPRMAICAFDRWIGRNLRRVGGDGNCRYSTQE